MLTFKVFDIESDGIKYNSTIELDPKSSKSMDEINYLNELRKDKEVYNLVPRSRWYCFFDETKTERTQSGA